MKINTVVSNYNAFVSEAATGKDGSGKAITAAQAKDAGKKVQSEVQAFLHSNADTVDATDAKKLQQSVAKMLGVVGSASGESTWNPNEAAATQVLDKITTGGATPATDAKKTGDASFKAVTQEFDTFRKTVATGKDASGKAVTNAELKDLGKKMETNVDAFLTKHKGKVAEADATALKKDMETMLSTSTTANGTGADKWNPAASDALVRMHKIGTAVGTPYSQDD